MSLKKIMFSTIIVMGVVFSKAQAINLSDFGLPSLNISYKACLLPDNTVYSAVQKHEDCPSYRELYSTPEIKSPDSRVNKGWGYFKFCYHNGELFDIKNSDGDCIWEDENTGKENQALASIHGGGLHYTVGDYNGSIVNANGTIDTMISNMHDDNDPNCLVTGPNGGLPTPSPQW